MSTEKIGVNEIKTKNRQIIYNYIRKQGSVSKQEIVVEMQLSLPTVTTNLDFLKKQGLIDTSGKIKNTGGRNATAFTYVKNARMAIGVDITANHITAVAVNLSGDIVSMERRRSNFDLEDDAYLREIGEVVIELGIRISAIFMIIALLDLAYQKWKFKEDMKMTKQEVKDEYKDQEGDPQIKGKQRQRMQEASRRRMMQALPEADVVITNPTHYAVALKYDSELYAAPIVLAKGADYLAQKIKEEAREYHIEIYENKPLARMLYTNVEVGDQIPAELYPAVAEVLAYVYHLQGKA